MNKKNYDLKQWKLMEKAVVGFLVMCAVTVIVTVVLAVIGVSL